MAKLKAPTEKMTYQEFLKWCDEDTCAEWVDGEVIMLAPASKRHQDLADFLVTILRTFVGARDLGVVLSAPFHMKTGPELPGREPDLLFIANQHLDRLEETHLNGPADLVVEIISSESRLRDRGQKFAEYEAGGIREYWILDPEKERADFYILEEERYERRTPKQGIYRSQVVSGFSLTIDWLWEEPLPPVLDLLGELELI